MRAIYVLLVAIGITAIIVVSIKDEDKPRPVVSNHYQATIVCKCDLNGDTIMVKDTTKIHTRVGDTVLVSSVAGRQYHRVTYDQNVADLDTVSETGEWKSKLYPRKPGKTVSNREAVIISQKSQ